MYILCFSSVIKIHAPPMIRKGLYYERNYEKVQIMY